MGISNIRYICISVKFFLSYLKHTTSLLIDQTGDTLDTATASKTANSRLSDTLDVITQHLAMTLGATLSQSFSTLSTASHCAADRRLIICCEKKKLLQMRKYKSKTQKRP